MRIDVRTILFTLLLFLFLGVCYLSGNQNMLLNWLGIAIYLYGIATWHWESKEDLFSLYSIFWSFLFIFSFGQCVMWAFHIGLDIGVGDGVLYYGSGFIPSETDMINTKWYTCISMLSFHIAALTFTAKRQVRPSNQKSIDANDADVKRKTLFITGSITTSIIAPIVIFQKATEAVTSAAYGYTALYYGTNATQGGYLQIISFLFFPGLVALLVGSGFSKVTTRNVLLIFGLYAFLGLISGDRGSWLYSLILLVWLLRKQPGRKKRSMVGIIIVGIIGIYLLSVITAARNSGGVWSLSASDFAEAFKLENSPIVDAFFEMGWSMGIITFFLAKGNGIYPYTNTYITSVLGAISSDFLIKLGIPQILLGDWFSQEYLRIEWGTGFSMIGEAYVNGGYVGGFLYMMMFGIIIGLVLRMFQTHSEISAEPIKAFVAVAFTNTILGFPRAAVYLLVKEFVYGICPILVIAFILKLVLYKKGVRREVE